MARLLAVTAVGQIVPGVAAATLSRSWVVGAALSLAVTAMFARRANVQLRGERRSAVATALVDVPYFVHWTAGLLALPLAIVFVLVSLGTTARALDAVTLAYFVALAASAYGALVRRRWVTTRRVRVAIDGLDARFDGYRIAHLSDLHIGQFQPRAMGLAWARAANALGADLVVVTGDMVANGVAYHEDIADVVGALRAKDGVLVVLGNHDHYGDADGLVALLEARGVRVLRNEGVRARGDDALFVAGVDDYGSRRGDLDGALRDRPAGAKAILLAHDPADFPGASARGVDLMLSGHTHGGQLAIPLLARHANLGRLEHRHTLGVYRENGTSLIVHPGLGTSGPPVRLGVAPSIVEVTLVSA